MRLLVHQNIEVNSEYANLLRPYIESLRSVAGQSNYESDESSINLPFDDSVYQSVEEMVQKKVNSSLKYIFLIGIGGSNLGTKAIYEALNFESEEGSKKRPELIFVDTNNSRILDQIRIEAVSNIEKPEDFLLISISKSGGTTETLANTEILVDWLQSKLGDIKDRLVVVTDAGSSFDLEAKKNGIEVLNIPHKVGGRYSVLSAVGLLPLKAAGFSIADLLQGAKDIRPYCLEPDIQNNPAAQSALILAEAMRSGINVSDTFVFNSELESLGKWYRQLMGESIGKQYDREGNEVRVGLTPTVSVGSTDLHSVGQLYLGGPKDKITTFIYNTDTDNSFAVPAKRLFSEVVEMIDGKNTSQIMEAILGGVKIAYQNNDLLFMEIQLSGINPYEIGAYMQYKMIEMMYLGRILNVNPFDQPNVESYKIATKDILSR
ncbi:hypothetical protein KC845_01380 [Candidatus Kaiserbacteria bacterium]|nr:hypothetical protein [Candidatus Kaiserbacteria bacterium]